MKDCSLFKKLMMLTGIAVFAVIITAVIIKVVKALRNECDDYDLDDDLFDDDDFDFDDDDDEDDENTNTDEDLSNAAGEQDFAE